MPTSAVNLSALAQESVWLDKQRYENAESQYYQSITKQLLAKNALAKPDMKKTVEEKSKDKKKADKMTKQNQNKEKKSQNASKTSEVADTKQQPKAKDKPAVPESASHSSESNPTQLTHLVQKLEADNKKLHQVTEDLKGLILKLESRVANLEKGGSGQQKQTPAPSKQTAAAAQPAAKAEDDDDVDLFGSDEEDDAEKERLHQERLKAYEAKKSKKPALIAKSNVILDVKPWDDETDMKEMERQVRTIVMDGLIWGASKLVPLAYGIHKLQISCVVEDEKVSVDLLQEQIEAIEELVQSVDIAAFNKV